jgi:hypothetical protein
MTADADDLRRDLRAVLERRTRGDLREKDFQRQVAELSIALTRAVVGQRLAREEQLVAEHHLVHSHLHLAQSILQEPEQLTVSFFATDRRLIRVRGATRPGRAVTCDGGDGTVVDDLPYAAIREVAQRSERRWGEVAVGLGAALLGLVAGDRLAVTGPLLAVLGLAGAAHGLLLPTRWVEVVATDSGLDPPFAIYGLRRKSARRLLDTVRGGMAVRSW